MNIKYFRNYDLAIGEFSTMFNSTKSITYFQDELVWCIKTQIPQNNLFMVRRLLLTNFFFNVVITCIIVSLSSYFFQYFLKKSRDYWWCGLQTLGAMAGVSVPINNTKRQFIRFLLLTLFLFALNVNTIVRDSLDNMLATNDYSSQANGFEDALKKDYQLLSYQVIDIKSILQIYQKIVF